MYFEAPQPEFKTQVNAIDGINSDIIQAIQAAYPKATQQVVLFAKNFQGNSRTETAANIWNFLKHRLTYKRDSDQTQTIKLPSRLLAEKKADCKSYSLFTAACLTALNMPVSFRYASYTRSKIPTHVYCTTTDEQGREIIIDGVWNEFNSEKPYNNKKEKVMNVVTLSGTEPVGSFWSGLWNATKKVTLAVPRAAFLQLVGFNFHHFGTNLAEAIKVKPAAVKKKWESLGGSYGNLVAVAKTGAKKKAILGIDPQRITIINGPRTIGNPAGVAAIIAAASGIIAAMGSLLAAIKKDTGANVALPPETQQAVIDAGGQWKDPTEGQPDEPEGTSFFDKKIFGIPLPLAIGGGAVAAYFLIND